MSFTWGTNREPQEISPPKKGSKHQPAKYNDKKIKEQTHITKAASAHRRGKDKTKEWELKEAQDARLR